MGPFDVAEAARTPDDLLALWVRGGFPDSFLAADDTQSFDVRRDFIRTYLERDVPQFGPRIPAETLERLWTMLAHGQGSLLNASRLSASLAISAQTVTRYIDLLADLMLVRRLPPLCQRRQAARQIAKGVCQGQRAAPRPSRHNRFQPALGPPGRRYELGGLCDREFDFGSAGA
jgi:predicted AAA+ superfamily ATPase